MRENLAAHASYNNTARMILLDQCRFQEQAAYERAAAANLPICAPPGTLSIGQFIAAWHNLGLGVSKQQASAVFAAHQADSRMLIDYNAFAMKMLRPCSYRSGRWRPRQTGGTTHALMATQQSVLRMQASADDISECLTF